jgi:hypothetical protein
MQTRRLGDCTASAGLGFATCFSLQSKLMADGHSGWGCTFLKSTFTLLMFIANSRGFSVKNKRMLWLLSFHTGLSHSRFPEIKEQTSTMITIDGIAVKGQPLPEKRLLSLWKTLSRKSFPKVKAFQLDDADFDRIIKTQRCTVNKRIELQEWGRILPTRGTDACVFSADPSDNFDYIILIRQSPYHGLSEILKHELSHIARGDL